MTSGSCDLATLLPTNMCDLLTLYKAIDEIGWTPYHWKLFVLNGFGYAVDSMILLFQSIIASSAFMEFGQVGYKNGLSIAAYVGMLTGAIFWGFGADIIGRKYAFNCSLFICSTACIVAGGMPSWPSLGTFIAILAFGGGGNLVMDTTVFLEYLPGDKQWLLTFLAAWWGVGQAIAGFIAWGFMVPERWNCSSVDDCNMDNNWGWRYVLFTGGALVLVLSILRITIIRLKETPKYLLGMGEDAQVVETLQYLANRYNRPCSLTLERLEGCGTIQSTHSKNRFSIGELLIHIRGLFSSRKMTISTIMIWWSWTLIGLAYPLFQVFLPYVNPIFYPSPSLPQHPAISYASDLLTISLLTGNTSRLVAPISSEPSSRRGATTPCPTPAVSSVLCLQDLCATLSSSVASIPCLWVL